jgi:hypothetical protein
MYVCLRGPLSGRDGPLWAARSGFEATRALNTAQRARGNAAPRTLPGASARKTSALPELGLNVEVIKSRLLACGGMRGFRVAAVGGGGRGRGSRGGGRN